MEETAEEKGGGGGGSEEDKEGKGKRRDKEKKRKGETCPSLINHLSLFAFWFLDPMLKF